MKHSKFSESHIIKALKENQQGRSVSNLSRELGIDKSTFYYWRKKYGGMEQQQLKRLKELEEENCKLPPIRTAYLSKIFIFSIVIYLVGYYVFSIVISK